MEALEEGPRTGPAVLFATLGAVLLALALTTSAEGRLLAAPAALGCLVLAARDLVLRPVLRADAHGLAVRAGLGWQRAAWDEVERLRVVTDRRAQLLEIDLGERVVLLSRARLGRHPQDVLEDLSGVQGQRARQRHRDQQEGEQAEPE